MPKEKPPGLAREAESIPRMNLAMKLEGEPHMRNQVNAESEQSPCPCLRGSSIQAPTSRYGMGSSPKVTGQAEAKFQPGLL